MSDITKQSIDDRIASGALREALADLKEFYASLPTLGNAQFVLTRIEKLTHLTPRTTARIAFLRTFTVEPVMPLLRASAALTGLDIECRVGEFGTYAQDLLSDAGFLSEFDPSIVVLALQTRDVLPDIWSRSSSLSMAELTDICDRQADDLCSYLRVFRRRSAANVIVHNLEQPERPSSGVLDAQQSNGQSASIRRFNERLVEIAAEIPGVVVFDYDALVARHGRSRWHDEQKWLTARMPIAAECLPVLAREYLHTILPITGKVCKALVCDLDNTLWGGVIGEDGMNGIQLDAEYPGAAYQSVQRAVLDLYERGVILAISSKNNYADAMQAIDEHAGMLLKSSHFAAVRINWNDKAQNLREIAVELNIGIDSLAFLDDNPVERRRVRTEIPEVHVIDLPEDPMRYAAALRACPMFERIRLSSEDKKRGRYYAEQRQRVDLAQGASSIEEFYKSLEQVVDIFVATPSTFTRVAQLTQKTNQFNLTTRRYTEPEIAAMAADPRFQVIAVRVSDRFGDNGIVAVAILRVESDGYAEIDTFLMSCRVIGRTVETAMLADLMQRVKQANARTIWGWFLPTPKNKPAESFYQLHGFTQFDRGGSGDPAEGATAWRFDLSDMSVEVPEWIKLVSESKKHIAGAMTRGEDK